MTAPYSTLANIHKESFDSCLQQCYQHLNSGNIQETFDHFERMTKHLNECSPADPAYWKEVESYCEICDVLIKMQEKYLHIGQIWLTSLMFERVKEGLQNILFTNKQIPHKEEDSRAAGLVPLLYM